MSTEGPENELQDVQESTESGIIKEEQPQTQNYETTRDLNDKDSDSHQESGVEQDERRKGHRERKSPSRSASRSRSRSPKPNLNSDKGCCKSCLRENRPNGRACICQVPSSQRRSHLGREGCITCRCTGCHPDDLEKKSKDTHSSEKSENRNGHEKHEHDRERERDSSLKNGCCKSCMKAFSENKRACLCQVPIHVRHGVLPPEGCKVCGCRGCHPEEILMRKQGYSSRQSRSDRGMYPPPYDRYYYDYPRGRMPPPYMEGPPPPSYHDRDRDPYRMAPYPVRAPPPYYPPPHRSRYDHPPYHHEDSQRYPDRPPSDRYRRSRSRSREREPRKRDREREDERYSPKRIRENWRGE